jgi:hypothetical protein
VCVPTISAGFPPAVDVVPYPAEIQRFSVDFISVSLVLPPRMTFGNERFIALHMMYDKMAPELPIKAPTIVIKLLFNMKPSAQRAQPE